MLILKPYAVAALFYVDVPPVTACHTYDEPVHTPCTCYTVYAYMFICHNNTYAAHNFLNCKAPLQHVPRIMASVANHWVVWYYHEY